MALISFCIVIDWNNESNVYFKGSFLYINSEASLTFLANRSYSKAISLRCSQLRLVRMSMMVCSSTPANLSKKLSYLLFSTTKYHIQTSKQLSPVDCIHVFIIFLKNQRSHILTGPVRMVTVQVSVIITSDFDPDKLFLWLSPAVSFVLMLEVSLPRDILLFQQLSQRKLENGGRASLSKSSAASEWVTFQADEIMLYFEEDRCEQMCYPVIQSAGSFYLLGFYVPVFFLPLSIRIFFLLLNLFAVFVNTTIINLRTNLLLTRQTLLCIYCNEHIDSVMTPKLTWTWWGYLCLIHDVWLSYSCRHVGCYCRSYILYIMHFAFYLYTFIDH